MVVQFIGKAIVFYFAFQLYLMIAFVFKSHVSFLDCFLYKISLGCNFYLTSYWRVGCFSSSFFLFYGSEFHRSEDRSWYIQGPGNVFVSCNKNNTLQKQNENKRERGRDSKGEKESSPTWHGQFTP